ncbi:MULTISPECIES: DUF2306 domain-containing protein [unclassified Lysobacter]|uniref:DUF2306 domain-containing protein n=1 Tax=unclassified Lysobacter TaxID=2635362 RepID=UPI00138EFC8B|nr:MULTISPECIES: DUF2306 domain-containing protein [unclassified Lysobacter]
MSSIQSLGPSRLFWRVGSAIVLLALGIIGIDFLLTVYGNYHQLDPAAYAMFWARRGWLWTHLAGGALTIILGLIQFLTQWPRAYSRLHRWTGRVYMTSMLIACVGATGLIATSPAPFAIRAAFAATALAWLTTALIGVIAIRGRRVPSHRRWMVRNYLVTLAPITFRALIKVPGMMELAPPPVMIPILLWLSWLLPLLICEGGYRIVDRAGLRPSNSFKPKPLRGSA